VDVWLGVCIWDDRNKIGRDRYVYIVCATKDCFVLRDKVHKYPSAAQYFTAGF